jgi:hypothetical protein
LERKKPDRGTSPSETVAWLDQRPHFSHERPQLGRVKSDVPQLQVGLD